MLTMLTGCARPPAEPLPSEAYVWQRVWTDAVPAAIARHRDDLAGIRVQAMAVPGHGAPRVFAVPLATVAAQRLPVRAVVRVEGRRVLDDGAALVAPIVALARRWQAAGIAIDGIEIDYDCASARLPRYADWLALLRRELPPAFALSITALPAWLDAPSLDVVLAAVDQVVLQVHGVDDPHGALFDAARAAAWIARWSARGGPPFRVSLPAYATRVAFAADGTPVAIESEAPVAHAGVAARELFADPVAVAALVARLDRERPPGLAGLIWFRLPIAGDRRAWDDATLAAVLRRALPAPTLRASWRDGRDIALTNAGATDAALPARVVAAGACSAGDGVAGYTLMRDATQAALRRDTDGWIRAGESRILGWLRCDAGETVQLHVHD